MTIQQLKYVSAVEKYGSITKAAQKLYVSQPSVSAVNHALEEGTMSNSRVIDNIEMDAKQLYGICGYHSTAVLCTFL